MYIVDLYQIDLYLLFCKKSFLCYVYIPYPQKKLLRLEFYTQILGAFFTLLYFIFLAK